MPWFNIELEEDLSRRFKSKIIQRYGKIRGNLVKSFAEAVEDWVKRDEIRGSKYE